VLLLLLRYSTYLMIYYFRKLNDLNSLKITSGWIKSLFKKIHYLYEYFIVQNSCRHTLRNTLYILLPVLLTEAAGSAHYLHCHKSHTCAVPSPCCPKQHSVYLPDPLSVSEIIKHTNIYGL